MVAWEDPGFDTPEAAALDSWPPAACARITSTTVRGDRAEIVLELDPSYRYEYWVYCIRRQGRWFEGSSANGPTIGWDDPDVIGWQ
jgi:hypothetical protein